MIISWNMDANRGHHVKQLPHNGFLSLRIVLRFFTGENVK